MLKGWYRKTLALLVGVILVFAVACHPDSDYIHPCPPVGSNQDYGQRAVRNYRAERNRHDLFCNWYAQDKAQKHAEELARAGRLYHSTLENGYPSGYWCFLGENVAVTRDTGLDNPKTDIDEAILAWDNSDSHRNVMLHDAFEWIGYGIAHDGVDKWYHVLEVGTRHDSPRCGLAGSSAPSSFSTSEHVPASEGATVSR